MKALISGSRSRAVRAAPAAAADTRYPARPIRIVVGFSRGGIADVVARLVRSALETALGVQVIVDNVPGGGGATAAQTCANAAPDGYTLMMATCGEMAIAPSMRGDLRYDASHNFAPIALVTATPLMLVAGPGARFSDLGGMIAAARQDGRELTCAIPALGGPHHITGEWLRQLTGVSLAWVMYDGGAPAMADVIRGKIDLGIVALPPALPHIRSGTARPIAVTGRERISLAPGCPTIAESGYPEFDTSIWIGVVAPANTPALVVERLNAALNAALADADVRHGLAAYGALARGGSPDQFGSLIASDIEKYRRIIRSAHIDGAAVDAKHQDIGARSRREAMDDRVVRAAPIAHRAADTAHRAADTAAEAPSPVKIAFRGVTKRYPARGAQGSTLALERLDVEIRTSEIITVLGPTGCGKSTALNMIAGFEAPSDGSVLVDREQVSGPAPERAVVFQQAALFPWLSVFGNVTLGVKCRGMPKEEYTARAARLIKEVGLTGFENHYPYQLSGGMQQRVQIARALIAEPQVLLMDEPFGALDSQTRILMQELLLQLWLEHLPTVFFITHDVAEAIFIADRVLLMSRRPGRVKLAVDIRTPKPRTSEFLTSPEFVELQRELLGAMQEEVRMSATESGGGH